MQCRLGCESSRSHCFAPSFSGKFEFELAFDLNQRDAEGQTVLYLATCVGNLKIVELLLGFRVKGRRRVQEAKEAKKGAAAAAAANSRRRRPMGVSRDDTGEVAVARQQVSDSRSGFF